MKSGTILVDCGTINVAIPEAELADCAGAPGLRYHPKNTRGRLGWPIVIDADGNVLDPDEKGRFTAGRALKTFEELLTKPTTSTRPKKARKKKTA